MSQCLHDLHPVGLSLGADWLVQLNICCLKERNVSRLSHLKEERELALVAKHDQHVKRVIALIFMLLLTLIRDLDQILKPIDH